MSRTEEEATRLAWDQTPMSIKAEVTRLREEVGRLRRVVDNVDGSNTFARVDMSTNVGLGSNTPIEFDTGGKLGTFDVISAGLTGNGNLEIRGGRSFSISVNAANCVTLRLTDY